jgi:15-hydroxyprostaglandin dehydrogenase (NAD)
MVFQHHLPAANAGISTNMTAPTGMMTTEADGLPQKPPLQVLDVNLMGTIYSIKLFLHHINKQNPTMASNGGPKARIVITGSEGGLYALPADPVYCASSMGYFCWMRRPI